MALTIALFALGVGFVARQRPKVGPALVGSFGAFVALSRPMQGPKSAVPALVGAVAGAGLIWYFIAAIRATDPARIIPGESRSPKSWDRRRFMFATGAALATVAARQFENRRLAGVRDSAPNELTPVATKIPTAATLSPETPFLTPNSEFYLIDTALSVPRLRLNTWAVSIGGRVERPLRLTYEDLLARAQVERVVTIACVSNKVGGDLIGNAVWQGVLLAEVFGTSVDGWTCGFPVEAALDGRDAMIALRMNGEQLPLKHEFPARMIVPGLYGYVSATKWLSRIDLTTWEEAVGYWVPCGWAGDAPIKTQSRIWLDEWEKLIDGSVENLLAMLTSRSPKARELRQNPPFAGLLTEEQRNQVAESWKAVRAERMK